MKKIIYVLMFLCLSFSLFACGGSSSKPVQKGYDLYIEQSAKSLGVTVSEYKSIIEKGLTVEYVWLYDEALSSGECVYYKGSYGNWSDPDRAESTSFYFTYDVETGEVESASSYMYTLAKQMAGSYSGSETGRLIG